MTDSRLHRYSPPKLVEHCSHSCGVYAQYVVRSEIPKGLLKALNPQFCTRPDGSVHCSGLRVQGLPTAAGTQYKAGRQSKARVSEEVVSEPRSYSKNLVFLKNLHSYSHIQAVYAYEGFR